MHPPQICDPGEYPPAPKKRLLRDSTINDVADFVVDFINNDKYAIPRPEMRTGLKHTLVRRLGMIANNFLLIADRETIFHADCLKLAELHSWAVDFAKNGIPVPLEKIPHPDSHVKPDWYAPEILVNNLGAEYYESQSVLGKLFRSLELPRLSDTSHDSHTRQRMTRQNLSLEETLRTLSLDSESFDDDISVKLLRRLHPLVDLLDTEELTSAAITLFDHYAAELEHICYSFTLSRKATARLSEEEVFMGTIIAKSPQHRMRQDVTSRMRDATTTLVFRIREELVGGEDASFQDWMNRAWAAWKVSIKKDGLFASKTFGWIAMRALFDGIKCMDGDD